MIKNKYENKIYIEEVIVSFAPENSEKKKVTYFHTRYQTNAHQLVEIIARMGCGRRFMYYAI